MLLRFIILLGYGIGSYFLQRYFQRNPPECSESYVFPERRPALVLLRIAGPLLGPILGFMWMDLAPFTPILTILLFITLPLVFVFLPWLWRAKLMSLLTFLIYAMMLFFLILFTALIWLLLGGKLDLTHMLVLLPMLIFMLVPPAFAVFLFNLWAPEVLPLTKKEQQEHRKEAQQLLTSFFTTYPKPSIVVVEGETQTRVKGNAFRGSGPGLVITEPENAVVLRSGYEIKGIIGPGTVFTDKAQVVCNVLDLQRQFRSTKFEALTRDGIRVRVPCGSAFQIDSGQNTLQIGEPWPYRKSAAYSALFSGEVNPEGKTPLDAHEADSWKDIPLQMATHRLQQMIANLSLDDLYSTKLDPHATLTRITIGKEARELVKKELGDKGIQIIGGGVGNKIVPVDPEVTKQRVETWKARWIQETMRNKGAAEVKHLETMERIRSKVLNELILSLVQQADTLAQAGEEISGTLITLRLLERLEDMAHDPNVTPLLTDSTFPMLGSLQQYTAKNRGGL